MLRRSLARIIGPRPTAPDDLLAPLLARMERDAATADDRWTHLTTQLEVITERLEALERHARGESDRIEDLGRHADEVASQVGELGEHVMALRAGAEDRLLPLLRALVEEEAENRRRLARARSEPAYEAAFTEAEPLVSVIVPTRADPTLLMERSLPSLLRQEHERLEVIVVGDAVGGDVADAVAAVDDPRVSFVNLTHRVASHADPARQHHVSSAMARNEGQRRAGGRWIVQFDDDDALVPGAIRGLLERARATRAEVVYGAFLQQIPEREPEVKSAFPPRWGHFGFQGAIVHSGLRFFERELVSAHLDVPSDMFLLRRMVRAGVRFALHDEVVVEYFPALHWSSRRVDPVLPTAWPLNEISSAP